jgi:hypothetical protein
VVNGCTRDSSDTAARMEADQQIASQQELCRRLEIYQYAFLLLKMRSKVMVMICRSNVRLQLRR